jgi:hypothetical protein
MLILYPASFMKVFFINNRSFPSLTTNGEDAGKNEPSYTAGRNIS